MAPVLLVNFESLCIIPQLLDKEVELSFLSIAHFMPTLSTVVGFHVFTFIHGAVAVF